MPTIRIGYSSDFSINSNGVGIGTTFAAANTKLDVVGALKGDFNVTGVTTLAAYGGFVAQQQHVNKSTTIGFATVGLQTAGVSTSVQYYETETGFTDLGGVHHGDDQYFNALSEDLVIDDGQILNITNTDMVGVTTIGEYDPHNHSSYVCAGSLEQVSVTGHFSVPNGGINDRQETPIEGTVRFNDDLNTLEFFNGNEWRQFTYNQGQSGRGVYGGGNPSPTTAAPTLTSVNIHTLGNSVYFGDSTNSNWALAGSGCDGKRGVFAGGLPDSSHYNTIEYITMSGGGNAINFGDLSNAAGRDSGGGCSSSTRALFTGALFRTPGNTSSDIIDYIEIQTTGNALDFGDLSPDSSCNGNGFSSPTRGFFQGGGFPSSSPTIKVVTIASKGDATKFGEMSSERSYPGGAANSTRGLISGGWISPAGLKSIDYITMSSEGNAINFGDLTQGRHSPAGASTLTRAIFSGGYTGPSSTTDVNTIDYVTISTTGDAVDFGDLMYATSFLCSASDSHGGLGGF